MKIVSNTFGLGVLISLCAFCVQAQTTPATDTRKFEKDGLTFIYSAGWTLQDTSDSNSQQFNFRRNDSEAEFRLFVYRNQITSPEKLAEARKVLIDPYVASTVKTFEGMGANPVKSPVTTDIGSVKSDGVKVGATLGGESGAAEIHWALVGERLVVLTMFGPDRALKKAAPAWDTLRTSIAVGQPKPAASPSPQ